MRERSGIVAHRGGAALWPENSLLACRSVLELGIEGVEIDVHMSRDGQVVVIHDAQLERTTLGTGHVVEHDLEELQRIGLRGAEEEKIPSLDEILSVLAPAGVTVSVELKTGHYGHPYPGLAEATLRMLSAHDVLDRAFVHGFLWDYVHDLRALAPDVAWGCNVEAATIEHFESFAAVCAAAQGLGARDINVDFRLLDKLRVTEARQAGLGITCWTPNEEADLLRCFRWGVDYVATDQPSRAIDLRRRVEADGGPTGPAA